MKNILIFPLALVFLVFFSCTESRSKAKAGILSEERMVELMVDTHLVDALISADSTAAAKKREKGLFYYPSVLEKYGITKAQMDSSVAWYMRNPAAYARVYGAVLKDLEARKATTQKDVPVEE